MSADNDGSRILAFYEGTAPDDRGRLHEEILRFDDAALESVHDYIQWLFPMRERSGASPTAPRLNSATIEQFRRRPELRNALRRSLDRMLAFYGLEWRGETIARAPSFAMRNGWLSPMNHNYLRLTRILTSLRILGDELAMKSLHDCLTAIASDERRSGRKRIPERTLHFWNEAAGRSRT